MSIRIGPKSRAPAGAGWGGGGGAPPCPHVYRWRMSRRQSERASRFQVEIEEGVQSAAVAFRDNHVEASVSTAVRLWWTSHVRGWRFAQLVRQAYDVTQARISLAPSSAAMPADAKRCRTSWLSCATSSRTTPVLGMWSTR